MLSNFALSFSSTIYFSSKEETLLLLMHKTPFQNKQNFSASIFYFQVFNLMIIQLFLLHFKYTYCYSIHIYLFCLGKNGMIMYKVILVKGLDLRKIKYCLNSNLRPYSLFSG